ncbi:MAG: ComEC/Rec2 family competence protein [Ilumatobacteraceae bacterium]
MSSHHVLVFLALVSAVAARLGSELAARNTVVFRVAAALRRILPVQWWWLAIAVCIGATVCATSFAASRSPHVGRWVMVVISLTLCHGAVQWQQLASPRTGEFAGVAFARSDPVARGPALALILEVEGENFRFTAHGRARGALHGIVMGDAVVLDAQRVAYDARRLRFSAGRHVQGELRDVSIHAVAPSRTVWYRAAHHIHQLIDDGARTLQPHDAALLRGLILGDESRQPDSMTQAFRSAGLGHLLAVSGQNVVLVLAALTPALERLSRWPRLISALGIVAMFAVVTRLESSVVRAAVMAGVVQVGFAIGRDVLPLRALAFTVLGIVAVDPLATWSVGFVLSVAATTGLIVITPLLGESIFSASAAAQLGVAPFVLWWFGSLPVIALLTNVLAVPVASGVMIAGPPILAIAAIVPDAVASVLTMPVVAALRFVWWVAEWGTRLSPHGVVNAALWCTAGALFVLFARRSHH